VAKFHGDDIEIAGRKAAVRFTSRTDIVECRLLERIKGPHTLGRLLGFGKGADRTAALAAATADSQTRAASSS
jgi:hypothetical protein